MTRQSISLSQPNDDWLNSQVESNEFRNKSEVVNSLIRYAREAQSRTDFIRGKLIQAENSGFSDMNREEILAQSKEELKRNGQL
ncbi:MAG: type II toxin-antitoxin system ParD family antitoxin [Agarilytica sp.]